MSIEVTSHVPTKNASQYIHSMCKHFAHKVKSEWDQSQGVIHFAMGTCELGVVDQALRVVCRAENPDELEEVAECIREHFGRFAFREGLTLVWER